MSGYTDDIDRAEQDIKNINIKLGEIQVKQAKMENDLTVMHRLEQIIVAVLLVLFGLTGGTSVLSAVRQATDTVYVPMTMVHTSTTSGSLTVKQ